MRDDIINTDPQLVVAFALAQLRAITELKAMDHGQVSQVVEKYWHLTPDLGKQVIDGDILFVRGWAWPSESDARSLIQMSSFMADTKQIDAPLTWDQLTASLRKVAPLLKQAYDQAGFPPAAAFNDETEDLRGMPTWQIDQWSLKT
jgi:hypothetical protein